MKRSSFFTIFFLASPLVLTACRGKVVATATLHAAGSADVTFTSTGAPLVLWADTDGSWTSAATVNRRDAHFPAEYEIDVTSQGKNIGHLACSTIGSSEQVCGSTTTNGNKHSGDCEVKLSCALPKIPAGEASLHVVGKPGADVSEVKNMSINIRAQ